VEELLFRSLLLGGLSVVVPIWALVVATALLFGWMHSPQGQLGMVLTAAVSLMFAGLFLWRGSLLPVLVAHYVVNLMQLVLAYRHPERI
jgi:membrane protease YdiL (CAAX protease family)